MKPEPKTEKLKRKASTRQVSKTDTERKNLRTGKNLNGKTEYGFPDKARKKGKLPI